MGKVLKIVLNIAVNNKSIVRSSVCVYIIYCLLINVLFLKCCSASSRICRKLKHGYEGKIRYEPLGDINDILCPHTAVAFGVYRIIQYTDKGKAFLKRL